MKLTKLNIFRLLAAFASVYHLALGLIGTLGTKSVIQSVVESVYGTNLVIDDQLLYVAKFISAYMLAFAVVMGLLAWKPVKYSNLVWVAVTLFGVRIIERLAFYTLLNDAFKVSMARNLQVIIPIVILIAGLIILKPQSEQKS